MNLVTLWRHKGRAEKQPPNLDQRVQTCTVRDDTSEPVSHHNSARRRFDLGKGLKAMFQFGCVRVVKEKAGGPSRRKCRVAIGGRVPAQKPYPGVLCTAYFDKIYTRA